MKRKYSFGPIVMRLILISIVCFLCLVSPRYVQGYNEDLGDALGVSGQIGYAILGKFEPIFRLGWIDNNSDIAEDENLIIEGGMNFYIKSYASRIGLNYYASLLAGEMSDSMIKLYYQLLW